MAEAEAEAETGDVVGNVDVLVGEVEVAIGFEDEGAPEEAENDASVDEVADIEALAYVVGHDFEPDVAGLVSMTAEASGHEQGADSVTELAHVADLRGELAVVDSFDPGFDLSQPPQPENTKVEVVRWMEFVAGLESVSGVVLDYGPGLVSEDSFGSGAELAAVGLVVEVA